MKDQLKYFTAGVFIGISELLPGISGATVALMFGVYEKILNFLTKFRDLNLIIPLLVANILKKILVVRSASKEILLVKSLLFVFKWNK